MTMSTCRFTITRTLDAGGPLSSSYSRDASGRLTGVSNTRPGTTIAGVTYQLDVLDRRTKTTRAEDGSYWDYTYDADGQVLSATRRAPDTTPVPGAAFAFAYDGAGNRTLATVNGRESLLISNTLNQYTQRTVPRAVDVRGKALASAEVLVNDGLATRTGESFHRAVPIDNTTTPQHPQIRIHAVEPKAGSAGTDLKAEQIGRVYLPKTPEVYTYDVDGNLTTDGRWTYTWDPANRLAAMETVASVPATAKRKLDFSYDYGGRRGRKRVYSWNGSAWVLASERRFLYDGWNLIAEIVASTTPFVKTYAWGLDVSGSEQGAGGVGGLLMIREGAATHYPCYDGNGNVVALVRKADGVRSARYEYGPFGELLEVEENGIGNPFRFSTKFTDAETGLVYYGMRYYAPELGRWPSRDPIEEEGGVNLYGFVGNDPIGKVDFLGQVAVQWDDGGVLTIAEKHENEANLGAAIHRAGFLSTVADRIAGQVESGIRAKGTGALCARALQEIRWGLTHAARVTGEIASWSGDRFTLRMGARPGNIAQVSPLNPFTNGTWGNRTITLGRNVVPSDTYLHEMAHLTGLVPNDDPAMSARTPALAASTGRFYNDFYLGSPPQDTLGSFLTGPPLARAIGVEFGGEEWARLEQCCWAKYFH